MTPELITAIGGVASAGLNAASQARTNAMNREQANYAFQQQQQAIQRMNEYNSPAQQVLRMKAAGLNPSLAYGADGAMVGNQADVPAYNAIPAEAPNIGNLGAAMSDAIRTGIEVRDLKRREDLAVADIALKDATSFQAVMNGLASDAQREEILGLMGYKQDLMLSETALNYESVAKAKQEIDNLKESKREIQSRIDLNEQQIKTLAAQAGLSEAEAYAILTRLPYEVLQMDADTALSWAQTAVGRETVKKIARETRHIGFVEEMDKRHFNFDMKAWKIEQEKWNVEMNQNRRLSLIDNITRVLTFGIGAAAYRSGQGIKYSPQRVPSPIYTPNGSSFNGENWSR